MEVVLALGIVAVSMVTMVGTIPVGLSTVRDAMDATTKAQITQRIASEVMTTPFAQISQTLAGKTYYFDQEGFQQTLPDAMTRFQVQLSQKSSEYPGSANSASPLDDSISTVLLHVTFYGRPSSVPAADVALNVPN